MRHCVVLLFALAFLLFFSPAGRTEQRRGVIYEPFNFAAVSVKFGGSAYDLSETEREKLYEFVARIVKGTLLPIHECDFDVFVIEGFRTSESGEELGRLDDLFAQRVTRIRDVLTLLGIPEAAGYIIKPSENRPDMSADASIVSINVRYWIHRENEKIDPAHIQCKFGQPLR